MVPDVVLAVMILQTPSRSVIVIDAAPQAARYSTARFLSGVLATWRLDSEVGDQMQTWPPSDLDGP
jgi:hypothetical protein